MRRENETRRPESLVITNLNLSHFYTKVVTVTVIYSTTVTVTAESWRSGERAEQCKQRKI